MQITPRKKLSTVCQRRKMTLSRCNTNVICSKLELSTIPMAALQTFLN